MVLVRSVGRALIFLRFWVFPMVSRQSKQPIKWSTWPDQTPDSLRSLFFLFFLRFLNGFAQVGRSGLDFFEILGFPNGFASQARQSKPPIKWSTWPDQTPDSLRSLIVFVLFSFVNDLAQFERTTQPDQSRQ